MLTLGRLGLLPFIPFVRQQVFVNVSTGSIADGAVTTPKIADNAVTTPKIADDAVTLAKIQDIANGTILGNVSGGAASPSALTAAQVLTLLALKTLTGISISEGGAVLTVGIRGDLMDVPVACQITQCTIGLDQAATFSLQLWKDSYANFPPTVADQIYEANVVAAAKFQETGLSITLAAGDTLRWNVSANDLATRAAVSMRITIL